MQMVFFNVLDSEIEKPFLDFVTSIQKDTDIFCFQECAYKTLNLLQNSLSSYSLITDYKYLSKGEHFPQAIYCSKDFNILSTFSVSKISLGTGLGLYVELSIGNKVLHLINVHGTSLPGDKTDTGARITQSHDLIEFCRNLTGPVIIGGDFNLDINTKSVNMFECAGYSNLIKDFSIRTTRNNVAWSKYPNAPQMYADFAFVNSKVKVTSFEVIENEVSDHLPMILNIDF